VPAPCCAAVAPLAQGPRADENVLVDFVQRRRTAHAGDLLGMEERVDLHEADVRAVERRGVVARFDGHDGQQQRRRQFEPVAGQAGRSRDLFGEFVPHFVVSDDVTRIAAALFLRRYRPRWRPRGKHGATRAGGGRGRPGGRQGRPGGASLRRNLGTGLRRSRHRPAGAQCCQRQEQDHPLQCNSFDAQLSTGEPSD
jgi:hypothetical protein